MDRNRLEALVNDGLTVRQIADEVGKSYTTVRYWLQRHGLETKHRGPGKRSRLGTENRSCERHGVVPFVRDSHGIRCMKCRSEQVARRRRKVKELLVEEAGGCCARCGYDRYRGALQFHHVDPSQKRFALAIGGLTRSITEMRAEAAKCVLLCANCHAEIEGGIGTLV